MTLNGVMALVLRYFSEIGSIRGALRKVVEDVVVKKTSRSLSHLLMSFLFIRVTFLSFFQRLLPSFLFL